MQNLLNGLDGTAYLVDSQWRLSAFGVPNWRAFAKANGGDDAVRDEAALLGRPLLDFIHGEAVRSTWASALTLLSRRLAPLAGIGLTVPNPL